jgi:hypothetical protein
MGDCDSNCIVPIAAISGPALYGEWSGEIGVLGTENAAAAIADGPTTAAATDARAETELPLCASAGEAAEVSNWLCASSEGSSCTPPSVEAAAAATGVVASTSCGGRNKFSTLPPPPPPLLFAGERSSMSCCCSACVGWWPHAAPLSDKGATASQRCLGEHRREQWSAKMR